MDTQETAGGTGRRVRRWVVPVALVASGLVAGGALASGGIAAAASGSGSGSSGSTTAPPAWGGQIGSPADMTHGPGEKLLTGTDADKATAAAEAAVPNGTVIRVETDSDGSAYEAHMQKTDGSYVTVKMDASFNVTSTEDGFGPGPQMPAASNGSNA
jgi:hypothetical protein